MWLSENIFNTPKSNSIAIKIDIIIIVTSAMFLPPYQLHGVKSLLWVQISHLEVFSRVAFHFPGASRSWGQSVRNHRWSIPFLMAFVSLLSVRYFVQAAYAGVDHWWYVSPHASDWRILKKYSSSPTTQNPAKSNQIKPVHNLANYFKIFLILSCHLHEVFEVIIFSSGLLL